MKSTKGDEGGAFFQVLSEGRSQSQTLKTSGVVQTLKNHNNTIYTVFFIFIVDMTTFTACMYNRLQ